MRNSRIDDRFRRRWPRRRVMQAAAGAVTIGAGLSLAGCGGEAAATVIEMTPELTFNPATVTVTAGATVTWRNVSGAGVVHTATCDPAKVSREDNVSLPAGASAWDSGLVQPGAEWQLTLSTPGEYRYCCLPHEAAGMLATITVEA